MRRRRLARQRRGDDDRRLEQLSYDPSTDLYRYTWKTDKAWAGTCRQLVVKLADGAEHRASFSFS